MKNKSGKKTLSIKKHIPLIVLAIIFLVVFFLKALLYELISGSIFSAAIFNLVPDYAFYVLAPFYYVFVLPILWLFYNIPNAQRPIISIIHNDFYSFSLDIVTTILWMTFLFFLIRFVWEKTVKAISKIKKSR